MKIFEFDREKGIYKFELTEIRTDFHAHPAVEIVFSETGGIEIETKNSRYTKTSLAIIGANTVHKITAQNDVISLLLVECNPASLQNTLADFGLELNEGIYVEIEKPDRKEFANEIIYTLSSDNMPLTPDERIRECLTYLNSSSSDYKEMLKVLKSKTNLSESRISHLFKEEMGTSIKKYMVWSKLKRAFERVVLGDMNMYEVSFACGFYDQAHLSKAFKQMLGLNPSAVYNSRMLQV